MERERERDYIIRRIRSHTGAATAECPGGREGARGESAKYALGLLERNPPFGIYSKFTVFGGIYVSGVYFEGPWQWDPAPYSTTPRNGNPVNGNHLDICLSFSQKNGNSLTWVLVALTVCFTYPVLYRVSSESRACEWEL